MNVNVNVHAALSTGPVVTCRDPLRIDPGQKKSRRGWTGRSNDSRKCDFAPRSSPINTHTHNGFARPLAQRPACPAHSHQLNQPSGLLDADNTHPGPTRNPPPPPQTPLHIHPTRHPLRRLVLRTAHYFAPARIQGHQGHAQHPPVEPQLAKAVERRGGRGRQAGRFQSKVRKRMGCFPGTCTGNQDGNSC